jgi:hypothetical protein
MEVPDDVLTAARHVVAWARGCEDEVDTVIEYDAPIFENWLRRLGLLPPFDDDEIGIALARAAHSDQYVRAPTLSVIEGGKSMKQQIMEAELMFNHPDGRDAAIVELVKREFTVEELDWRDEYRGELLSDSVWIRVSGTSELTESAFFDSMQHLVAPFGGEVLEAGLQSQFSNQQQ